MKERKDPVHWLIQRERKKRARLEFLPTGHPIREIGLLGVSDYARYNVCA